MTLPASTSYLLESCGVRPAAATPQDVLIVHARTIRETVRRWWLELDPEHTAGISVELMETSLVRLAETLVKLPRQRIVTTQALGLVTRQLVAIHGKAELTIARRLFDGAARLGVLAVGGTISFAQQSLFELYLGYAYRLKSAWPAELARQTLFSVKPVDQPWGRAVWARLAFTEPESLEHDFGYVAGRNLHLAAWYLYCDAPARERFGAAFAAALLELASWDGSQADSGMLDRMLASLGDFGVEAARERLFETEAILPAMSLAARVLGRRGGPGDVERLTALAANPGLGQWEIERMRQAIREAQSLTLDPEVLRKYRKEELVEFGKGALAVLLMIGGAILLTNLKLHHRLPGLQPLDRPAADSLAHGLQHGLERGVHYVADDLAHSSTTEIMALQRTLRERLAFLPAEIERRKADIERSRPYVQWEIQEAARTLAARLQT